MAIYLDEIQLAETIKFLEIAKEYMGGSEDDNKIRKLIKFFKEQSESCLVIGNLPKL